MSHDLGFTLLLIGLNVSYVIRRLRMLKNDCAEF